MSALNLKRNSRVFFTTNVATGTNKVNATGFTLANTQELTILDGFSFNQAVTAQPITVNEAGATPTRGQRSFNTALNPVEFSFSTYIRPNISGALVVADEYVLWNALFGDSDGTTGNVTFTGSTTTPTLTTAGALTVAGTAMPVIPLGIYTFKNLTGVNASQVNTPIQVTNSSATTLVAQYLVAPANTTIAIPVTAVLSRSAWNTNAAVAADTVYGTTAYSEVTPARSNVNTLLPFGMCMVVDNVTYTIDNCALDQASIDFGLDGIAMIAWTGKGTQLNVLTTNVALSAVANPVMSGGLTGTATGKSAVATTRFLTNKISTVGITSQIGGGGTIYNLALTGGNITIANNLTYLTPANLGVVNIPIGYYTATRSITGSVNAYMRQANAAARNTGDLFTQILTDSTTNGVTELKYQLSVIIGGANPTRVEVLIPGASLQVPTLDAGQDIISTVINFTAQGADALQGLSTSNFNLLSTNDMRIRYLSN